MDKQELIEELEKAIEVLKKVEKTPYYSKR